MLSILISCMKICLVFVVFLVLQLAAARHLSHGWVTCDPKWLQIMRCDITQDPHCAKFPDGTTKNYRNQCSACHGRMSSDYYVRATEAKRGQC